MFAAVQEEAQEQEQQQQQQQQQQPEEEEEEEQEEQEVDRDNASFSQRRVAGIAQVAMGSWKQRLLKKLSAEILRFNRRTHRARRHQTLPNPSVIDI